MTAQDPTLLTDELSNRIDRMPENRQRPVTYGEDDEDDKVRGLQGSPRALAMKGLRLMGLGVVSFVLGLVVGVLAIQGSVVVGVFAVGLCALGIVLFFVGLVYLIAAAVKAPIGAPA